MDVEPIFQDKKLDYWKELESNLQEKKKREAFLKDNIPFMVSDQGELVCLPKTRDPPTLGCLGSKRTGKTLTLAGLRDRIYLYRNEPCIWANDYSSETLSSTEPMENPHFVKMLKHIGEVPTGLDGNMVYLFPGNIHLNLSKKYNGLSIGVTLKKFIERFELFVGAGQLTGSEKYFDVMKPELLKCKSTKDMESVIMNFPLPFKSKEATRFKIWTFFYNALVNEKIVDISNKELVSEIEVLDEDNISQGTFNPILACAYYGFIPVIMTQEILTKKYFPGMYTSLLEELFMSQRYSLDDSNRRLVNIFFDELRIISRKELLKEKKEYQRVVEMINQLVAQGGPARIALYYATQNPSEIPDVVFNNTKYVICTALAKEEANCVANLFGLDKADFAKRISGLSKNSMECIAVTNEEFVIYDSLNNKKYSMTGEVKGRFLPPLSNTVPPIL